MPKLLYISNISGKKLSVNFLGSAMYAARELGWEFLSVANRDASTPEQMRADEEAFGVKLFHIDLARAPYSPKNIKAYRQLCKIIRDEGIDCIHCNTPTGGLLGRLAGKRCKVKTVIYQAHGFHFYRGAPKLNWLLYYPIERWLARRTDALVTINREDYELASAKLRLRRGGRVYYVHGVGLDTQAFAGSQTDRVALRASLGMHEEDVILLSVGRLDVNKNHEISIRAVAKAAAHTPRTHLLICGEGAERSHLESLAVSLGVADRVHLLGNRSDMPALYQAADIMLMMSFREGLSRSLMEAMASGLPCIASRIRGNVDLLCEGEGGYLVPPTDAEQMAERITYLSEHPEVRRAMAEANRATIRDFDITRVTWEVRRVYEAVVKDTADRV